MAMAMISIRSIDTSYLAESLPRRQVVDLRPDYPDHRFFTYLLSFRERLLDEAWSSATRCNWVFWLAASVILQLAQRVVTKRCSQKRTQVPAKGQALTRVRDPAASHSQSGSPVTWPSLLCNCRSCSSAFRIFQNFQHHLLPARDRDDKTQEGRESFQPHSRLACTGLCDPLLLLISLHLELCDMPLCNHNHKIYKKNTKLPELTRENHRSLLLFFSNAAAPRSRALVYRPPE